MAGHQQKQNTSNKRKTRNGGVESKCCYCPMVFYKIEDQRNHQKACLKASMKKDAKKAAKAANAPKKR